MRDPRYNCSPYGRGPGYHSRSPAGSRGKALMHLLDRFFLHSRSLRLCIASVRFLSSSSSVNISLTYISDMTWPILTRLGHKYRLTIPFMSYDQTGVKGHIGVTGVKKVISLKMLLLLQITGYDQMTHVYTSAWPPLQKLSL